MSEYIRKKKKRKRKPPRQATMTTAARDALAEELALYESQNLALDIESNNLTHAAQKEALAALQIIVDMMKDVGTKKALRLRAAQEVLLRAHGRPMSPGPPRKPSELTNEEIEARAKFIIQRRGQLRLTSTSEKKKGAEAAPEAETEAATERREEEEEGCDE